MQCKSVSAVLAVLSFAVLGCATQAPCVSAPIPECNCPKAAGMTASAAKEETEIPQTNDIREVEAFLKAQKTYYIATADGDRPHVRPFGTANIYEGKLYIQTGLKKDVAKHILANPNIEIVSYDNKGTWLRIAATAVHDEDIAAQTRMLEAYPDLKSMYTPGDGNTAVFRLEDATATFYGFSGEHRSITF